jgi:prolyl-tRNA synthetase
MASEAPADGPIELSKSAIKKAEKQAKMAADKAAKAAKATLPVVGGKKTDDIIGITMSKEKDFSGWYQEVVLKSEMIEYYNEISGFFILRPRSMFVWGVIKDWFDAKIKAMDVEDEGFAPELAWVTKALVAITSVRQDQD